MEKCKYLMRHFYQNIQGWSHYLIPAYRNYLTRLKEYNIQVVEVGCWAGKSTAFLATELFNNNKNFKLHCVDHWQGCDEEYYTRDDVKNRNVAEEFVKNMEPVKDYIRIYQMSSVEAANQFAERSLDMICVDDGHDYESVCASIDAWWPKLKHSGWMIGDDHDEHYPDVVKAVQERFVGHYYLITEDGFTETENLTEKNGAWIVQKI